jgi:hypothetical protein
MAWCVGAIYHNYQCSFFKKRGDYCLKRKLSEKLCNILGINERLSKISTFLSLHPPDQNVVITIALLLHFLPDSNWISLTNSQILLSLLPPDQSERNLKLVHNVV